MSMTLDQWQERLLGHFSQLAAERLHTDLPLFALEHDLSEEDFQEIAGLLRTQLSEGRRLERHWLVWVVYATEWGYDYDGGEYWDSFEARTPLWREVPVWKRRRSLREWFAKFHLTFQGVKPSGPWAEHFSIIAWPITHAILPLYLQSQLARQLHEIRHHLATLEVLSPTAVGGLLAANAHYTPSRYQEFLQQRALAGRIVLALLCDRSIDGPSPIYLPTLNRMISDLEDVQQAREWLNETRSVVADRLKGAGKSPLGSKSDASHDDTLPLRQARTRIRPTLLLRRSGAETWEPKVSVTGISAIAKSNSDIQSYVRSTRCRIVGAVDQWLPNEWLLSGPRSRVLKIWPGGGATLVQFERPNPAFDQLAGEETRLSEGPTWLCKIGRDGLAREVAGRVARPGQKYVVLSETELPAISGLLSACNIECSGIHASYLSLPSNVSAESASRLHPLGIRVIRTVRIWPAGLPARGFDGEGRSEWLTTDAPCFGISHDHPVDAYVLRVNDGAETTAQPSEPTSPVFVRLDPLPAGTHTLLVKTRRAETITIGPAASGVITLLVREPEPWTPGTTSHAGLAVSLDLPNPDLDDLWSGKANLSILGPSGHRVDTSIRLWAPNGTELLNEAVAKFDLPVLSSQWREKFDPFAQHASRSWQYQGATSGWLTIRGDELGEYRLRLDREVNPVRWACQILPKSVRVRVIDDTDESGEALCRFFPFSRPDQGQVLAHDQAVSETEVLAPGGLLMIEHGKFSDTVAVSTLPDRHSFSDLLIDPDLSSLRKESVSLLSILEVLARWTHTRLLGPWANMRRNRIVERISALFFARICGDRWMEAESLFLSSVTSSLGAAKLEQAFGASHGLFVALRREHSRMDRSTAEGTKWFVDLSAQYKICYDAGLCAFALQLASRPFELPRIPHLRLKPEVMSELLDAIKANPTLARAARWATLQSAQIHPSEYGSMFPRWQW